MQLEQWSSIARWYENTGAVNALRLLYNSHRPAGNMSAMLQHTSEEEQLTSCRAAPALAGAFCHHSRIEQGEESLQLFHLTGSHGPESSA